MTFLLQFFAEVDVVESVASTSALVKLFGLSCACREADWETYKMSFCPVPCLLVCKVDRLPKRSASLASCSQKNNN